MYEYTRPPIEVEPDDVRPPPDPLRPPPPPFRFSNECIESSGEAESRLEMSDRGDVGGAEAANVER